MRRATSPMEKEDPLKKTPSKRKKEEKNVKKKKTPTPHFQKSEPTGYRGKESKVERKTSSLKKRGNMGSTLGKKDGDDRHPAGEDPFQQRGEKEKRIKKKKARKSRDGNAKKKHGSRHMLYGTRMRASAEKKGVTLFMKKGRDVAQLETGEGTIYPEGNGSGSGATGTPPNMIGGKKRGTQRLPRGGSATKPLMFPRGGAVHTSPREGKRGLISPASTGHPRTS